MNKIISVMGTPDLAAELSSVISTHSDNSVIIIDLDTMHPSLDLIMGVNQQPKNITSSSQKEMNTGLTIALDAVDKNMLSRELLLTCLQHKRKRLYVMTGNHNIEHYEYMRNEPLEGLIQKANEVFNTVILLISQDIYDSYTKICIEKSDIVLIPIKGDLLDIRNFNNDISFLISSYTFNKNKFIQVLFAYEKDQDISVSIIKRLCKFQLGGIIPKSKKRNECHNSRKVYIKCMEPVVVKQYKKLANFCGVKISKPYINKPNCIKKLFYKLNNKRIKEKTLNA